MDRKKILEMQATFARTPSGRFIGEKVVSNLNSILKDFDQIKSFTRCMLCGLQMDSDAFYSGCPNCGCKDLEDFDNRGLR